MAFLYDNVLLCGFRATGKSTIGKHLSLKLGWKFVEMDAEIINRAGRTVPEITKNGTYWQEFREIESKLLMELLDQKYVVISAGGGVGVNNHINAHTNETFGKLQLSFIKRAAHTFKVVLYATDQIIAKRMRDDELKKSDVMRPLLNEEKAKELEQNLLTVADDPVKQKEVIIESIISDSIAMYRIREELYNEISHYSIDTGLTSVESAVIQIYNNLVKKL